MKEQKGGAKTYTGRVPSPGRTGDPHVSQMLINAASLLMIDVCRSALKIINRFGLLNFSDDHESRHGQSVCFEKDLDVEAVIVAGLTELSGR